MAKASDQERLILGETMNTLVVCPKCEKPNRVALDRAASAAPVCGACKAELPLRDGVQDLSSKTLAKLVRVADRPVVVDFWAEWCGPCKAFAPTFKSAAKELGSQVVFAKLNTETFPDAGQAFQIRGIPTLVVFKNGKEIDRQSGAMPLPMLKEYLLRWK
jgi:thioredoxin 2